MSEKIIQKKYIFPELFSFVIPVVVMVIVYGLNGIYPGGKATVLTYDLRGQLLPMYGYLSQKGPGINNLFYSMSGGLGGNYFGSVALYLSPFDLIYAFVPVRYLADAVYFMILLKIGLCGLTACIFLCRNGKYEIKANFAVLLACCYALMSYNIAYSMSPMWYDAVMLLPLLALSAEKIICGKKSTSFVILMTFCIICDYYLAYMNAMALIIYVLFRLVEEGIKNKELIKRFSAFAGSGLISAGLSAFILIPVYKDFFRGKLSGSDFGTVNLFIINKLTDVLGMLIPTSYSNLAQNQPPNIFCGSLVLVLCILYLINKTTSLKTRVASFFIIVFYFISFTLGPLDRVWHGFKEPVGFSHRYSYTFVFFLICFALRGIASLNNREVKMSRFFNGIVTVLVMGYELIELFVNGSFLISKIYTDYQYANRAEYLRYCDIMQDALTQVVNDDPGIIYRIAKNYNYSSVDGALYGYDGLDYFSSSYNNEVVCFLNSLGLNSQNNIIRETGLTPPVASLLNVGYYLAYWFDKSGMYEMISEPMPYSVYRNENAFPIAFYIPKGLEDSYTPFGDNPFENINIVISELCDSDTDAAVFKRQEYIYDADDYVISANFITDKNAHYWVFSPFKRIVRAENINGITPEDLNYFKFYINGANLGTYGYYTYRYCADIGFIPENLELTLSLDMDPSSTGEIYLYYYDSDVMSQIRENIKGPEYEMSGNQLVLHTDSYEDTSLLISLPYEEGYKVYLDGVRTDYKSYRNALMIVSVGAGEHIIRVKYSLPGMLPGIIISTLFLIAFLLIYEKEIFRKNK